MCPCLLLFFAEIDRVRKALYSVTSEHKPLVLPEAQGPVVQLSEKLYVPVKTYPDVSILCLFVCEFGKMLNACEILIGGFKLLHWLALH